MTPDEPVEASRAAQRKLVTNEELWDKLNVMQQTLIANHRPTMPTWGTFVLSVMGISHFVQLGLIVHILRHLLP